MAIGQLVHLGAATTSNATSSISLTVPNDGSVVVGDLLVWVCVVPSSSRTLTVSGVSGSTDLGQKNVSGHASQVWYKLAAAPDLGATLTVTSSPGSIKQALLLGRVRGVNQTNPLGSPAAYGGGATLTGSTTKTTPTVTDVAVGSREISIVCDSRGASLPQTSSWTPPGGETKRGEAFTTDTTQASSAGWGDSDATVSGSVGNRLWTADQSAIGSYHTIAVASGDTVAALTAATETDTAQPLVGTKQLTPVVEQDAAQALVGNKVRALDTPATETDTAQALTGGVSAPLTPALEQDTAQPLIVGNGQTLGTAVEVVAAQPLAHAKNVLLVPAVETDTAVALTAQTGSTPASRTYRIRAEHRIARVTAR